MPRLLIVEDEDKLRRALTRGLAEEGFEIVAAADGESGLAHAMSEPFDCVILDVMLPRCDGIQLVSALRARDIPTPVLILSARSTIDDRVSGLDSGADDYLPKPFAWVELLARVRACLRRNISTPQATLRVGEIELDCARRRLLCNDRHVDLTIRESELLEYLINHRGKVVNRDQLAREVWHDPMGGVTNVVDVYINYLRKKLEKAGAQGCIQTVRGVGYILKD